MIRLKFFVLLLLCLGTAAAQTGPFQIRVQQDTTVFAVPNGASISLVADAIGKTTSLTITIRYTGQTQATLDAPQLFGSPDMRLASLPALPSTLRSGQELSLTVEFKPSTSRSVLSQFLMNYTETAAPPLEGRTQGTISLNITGTAPDVIVSYFLQTDANVIPLASGNVILFGPTLVG